MLNLLGHEAESDRLIVYIGKETGTGYLADCSIVTRGYKVKNKVKGRVGVIGPKRMLYERVIPAVEFLADTVSDMLENAQK
jgi:heat-inducible transcriptional repressor